jgi:hypothetical protein
LRHPAVFVFVDKAVLEAKLGVSIANLRWATRYTVERYGYNDMELTIRDQAIVEFKAGRKPGVCPLTTIPVENV